MCYTCIAYGYRIYYYSALHCYTNVGMYVCMHVCKVCNVCMYACMHMMYVCMCIFAYTYVSMSLSLSIYIYICIYIYIYIYILSAVQRSATPDSPKVAPG